MKLPHIVYNINKIMFNVKKAIMTSHFHKGVKIFFKIWKSLDFIFAQKPGFISFSILLPTRISRQNLKNVFLFRRDSKVL